jgi:parallel beta-helix repeat protein
MVIMHKPVRLQGWGAGSVTINALKTPPEKLVDWRAKVEDLITTGQVDLLPGQEAGFGGNEPDALFTEEGAGILVLPKFGDFAATPVARIDGFTIRGADTGGGIMVNGYADDLTISNNRIVNNSGFFGGGIRVGHPELTVDGLEHQDAFNDNVNIHHNQITQNGGQGGAGGGVSMCSGADDYRVTDNWICGNFNLSDGGGIGHLGLVKDENEDGVGGLIAGNTILFNESFNQGRPVSGGGIYVSGKAPIGGDTLTPGAGSVRIVSNRIQGNLAGAGDGGGIRTSAVNGQDVEDNKNQRDRWYAVDIFNNMIANNVAAMAGGGISMQDTANARIINNTVANNDSTATAGAAFSPGSPNESNPQPAGIVTYAHSAGLKGAFGNSNNLDPFREFSNPGPFADNIIRHNRSFYFSGDPEAIPEPEPYALVPVVGPDGISGAVIDDLAVLGTTVPECLDPRYSILTSLDPANTVPWVDRGCNYHASNLIDDPVFAFEYFNGGRGTTVRPGEPTTAISVPAAFDEGGNFIQVRFGPLTLIDAVGNASDYHIASGSPAVDAGLDLTGESDDLLMDFDVQPRPNPSATCGNGQRKDLDCVDIGADELQ